MNYSDLKDLINNIIPAIINYEDGNLVEISGIINEFRKFIKETAGIDSIKGINAIISSVLQFLMNGGSKADHDESLNRGIELLLKALGSLEEPEGIDESLKEEITSFENRHGGFLTGAKESKHEGEKTDAGKARPIDDMQMNSDAFKIFLVEADEKLVNAQDYILGLEDDPENREFTNLLFRVFHTIKGECGFLKIPKLGEICHNLESLLDLMRTDKLRVNGRIIDILFKGLDFSATIVNSLKKDDASIFDKISIEEFITDVTGEAEKAGLFIGGILRKQSKMSKEKVDEVLQKQKDMNYAKKFGEIAVESNLVTQKAVDESLNEQKKAIEETGVKKEKIDPIIKVKASQINYLVDMVGELLIAEDQLTADQMNANQLKKITRQIQYAAMQLRTVKVKNLFLNMKRVVRDVSKNLDKNVNTLLFGEELEIDRNLVENLEEPLVHLIRNSVHHGIESADERKQKNKTPEGNITISAERKGNSIVIGVEDDGAGLSREKILNKAIEKRLVGTEDKNSLSDNEIYNLIFLPGFSTAETVDYVSGRGVGMDIVKSAVVSNRGRVEIKTEKGRYTRTNLIFPLSTAIIDGMIIKSSGDFYIIPVSQIIESLKVTSGMINTINGREEVINLRGEIIPVINLSRYFNRQIAAAGDRAEILGVIVENSDNKKYALIVDEIISKKEIVVKSLGSKFKDIKGISSGTVLHGGHIGFVLDVEELIGSSKNT